MIDDEDERNRKLKQRFIDEHRERERNLLQRWLTIHREFEKPPFRALKELSQLMNGTGYVPRPEAPPMPQAAAPAPVVKVCDVPRQNTGTLPAQTGGDSAEVGQNWRSKARERALAIIARQRAKDLYPSQIDIADEIARDFRAAGITGAGGKPLAGAYIKRHALKGISSKLGKARSMSIPKGK